MRLWKNLKKMQREGQLQQQQGYKLGSRKRNVAAHSNAVMGIVGTPSPDNTWHTPPDDAWHTFSSRSTSSGFSPRVHVARLSYPDPLKKRHTTLTNITSERLPQRTRIPTYTIRICLSGSLTEVSKSYTLSQQPAMAHVPPPTGWKDKNEVTASHFLRSLPTIFDNRSNYHDLC